MWNKIKKAVVSVATAAVKTWDWFDGKKTKIGGVFFAGSWVLGKIGVPEYTVARQIFDTGSEVFILLGIGHAALKTEKGRELASGLSTKLKNNDKR